MAQQTHSNLPGGDKVYDLDEPAAFTACKTVLQQPKTENFVVGFNSAKAQCAVDIDQQEALNWLYGESRDESRTLWFNFWASEAQRPIIEAVAKHYDLSPRLAGLLCPAMATASEQQGGTPATDSNSGSSGSGSGSGSSGPEKSTADVEKGIARGQTLQQPLKPRYPTGLEGMTFSEVVQRLWHFCSVDFGRRYIYIGFNALYTLPQDDTTSPDDVDDDEVTTNNNRDGSGQATAASHSKPAGQRVWSSLLICDDGTVVSVFERPAGSDSVTHFETRRNVLNVFRHLSRQHNQDNDNAKDALFQVRVRWLNETQAATNNNAATGYDRKEAASLLFYYLFDDWVSTFKLIARVEHPYREKLEVMRQQMFTAAKVSLVQQVHDVGRQLTVLKLMYQSYELIVSRVIQSQRSSARDVKVGTLSPRETLVRDRDLRSSGDLSGHMSHLPHMDEFLMDDDSGSNVKLGSSAIFRFERLFDRIRLYALTEIEECIKEKESLVLMNFNLVALKESQAVEKLTRTTILLAKATILFLPVSLMTAYFSIQLKEIDDKYSLKTYWFCFLVVMILSILFLVVFGGITHTLEGKTVYRSVTRTLGRMILNAAGKRKRKAQ
ncbi:hypothetical protein A1O7_07089 [Cladophialophora yegresii CBS 114405]|uniref:ADP-ribosylation factor n=1 Tax=Cladophialophora yegresii CBS 114405 TaxID=1182544 RepID=W9VUM8_9EURO|nr:uncharacterized protein A1O7_07089 [Cladophialophora yegresii CBS 114405]EXJ56745.1 hypothetical protein A1O7_07089 [Cladophialophora yegresii CBS 114405]